MTHYELPEFVRIFGLILAIWFALIGWKLIPSLPTFRRRSHGDRPAPTLVSVNPRP